MMTYKFYYYDFYGVEHSSTFKNEKQAINFFNILIATHYRFKIYTLVGR